jgi:hypothetical protein
MISILLEMREQVRFIKNKQRNQYKQTLIYGITDWVFDFDYLRSALYLFLFNIKVKKVQETLS